MRAAGLECPQETLYRQMLTREDQVRVGADDRLVALVQGVPAALDVVGGGDAGERVTADNHVVAGADNSGGAGRGRLLRRRARLLRSRARLVGLLLVATGAVLGRAVRRDLRARVALLAAHRPRAQAPPRVQVLGHGDLLRTRRQIGPRRVVLAAVAHPGALVEL